MTIREFSFFRPLPIPDVRNMGEWLQTRLKSAHVRDLPPGRSDITPLDWNLPTHRFIVNVIPDGTGVLKIEATQPDSAIWELGSIFPDMHEALQRIQEPGRHIVLGGMQILPNLRKRASLLRVLEYVPNAGAPKKQEYAAAIRVE